MEIEAQLHIVADPLTHRERHLYELVYTRRRLMRPPKTGGTSFVGRVAHRTQHIQTVLSLFERFVRHVADAPVGVDADAITHVASQKHVTRHSKMLARNVPQRSIDTRDRRHVVCAATEERRAIHLLPVMLDPKRVLTDQISRKLLNRRRNRQMLSLKRALTPTLYTRIGSNPNQTGSLSW